MVSVYCHCEVGFPAVAWPVRRVFPFQSCNLFWLLLLFFGVCLMLCFERVVYERLFIFVYFWVRVYVLFYCNGLWLGSGFVRDM